MTIYSKKLVEKYMRDILYTRGGRVIYTKLKPLNTPPQYFEDVLSSFFVFALGVHI